MYSERPVAHCPFKIAELRHKDVVVEFHGTCVTMRRSDMIVDGAPGQSILGSPRGISLMLLAFSPYEANPAASLPV
jgi:hypothetical protein